MKYEAEISRCYRGSSTITKTDINLQLFPSNPAVNNVEGYLEHVYRLQHGLHDVDEASLMDHAIHTEEILIYYVHRVEPPEILAEKRLELPLFGVQWPNHVVRSKSAQHADQPVLDEDTHS
jgi:hypothetical protein